ncbi:B12-binding domain-containing radical SAM protein [Candidatus Woesearchaeota archaeon]|nr:B12-binding domain-containing radical SAM protein [Candidatus Woesearchaeota archaeon]
MDSKKSLFFFPTVNEPNAFKLNSGLSYIQAYLKEKSFESKQFLPQERVGVETVMRFIEKENPSHIGFCCYDTGYYFIRILVKEIRKRFKDIKIIVGGPTTLFNHDFMMQDCPEIDLCVIGDGELAFHEIISGKHMKEINGIIYREDNRIIKTPERDLVSSGVKGAELDLLSSPILSGLPFDRSNISIFTARGCVMNCAFCLCPTICKGRVRNHSIKRVVDELKMLHEILLAEGNLDLPVHIWDDNFSLDTERSKQICREIINKGIKLNIWAELRLDMNDDELLKLMKEAGFTDINFGLESASPKMLRLLNKVHHRKDDNTFESEKRYLEKGRKNIQLAKEMGFHTSVGIIIGLPTQTVEDVEETFRFIQETGIDEVQQYYLLVYKGTSLWNDRDKYGMKFVKTPIPITTHLIYPESLENMRLMDESRQRQESFERLNRMVAEYSTNKENCTDFFDFIIEKNFDISRHDNLIRKHLPFNGSIIFTDTSITKSEFIDKASRFIKSDIQTLNYYLLTDELYSSFQHNFGKIIQLTGARFLQLWKDSGIDDDKVYLVTLQDINDMSGFLDEFAEAKEFHETLYLMDSCKFFGKCPYPQISKLRLDGNGEVRSCFSCSSLGTDVSKLEEIQAIIAEKKEAAEIRRGCTDCNVKNECPKCLFPSPLSEEEYCRTMIDFLNQK